MIIQTLDAAVKAVCPIHGISIRRLDDKASWRIDFADGATPEQRTAAAAVVASFDVAAVQLQEVQQQQRRAADEQELRDTRLDNAILTLIDMTPAQRMNLITTAFPGFTIQQRNLMLAMMTMGCMGARALIRQ
jgi:hypothetical protein